jgi:glutathione synthase/RimK-type ligase-like ATP-grasp enzyme
MRTVNLILTCVGGAFFYDYIRALNLDPELRIRIIGTDLHEDVPARPFVDAFYTVGRAKEDPQAYTARILEIAQREQAQVILPCSDSEAEVLAQHAAALAQAGLLVPVTNPDAVATCADKRRLYTRLSRAGLPMAQFRFVDTAGELRAAAAELGYPHVKLALKPRTGAGSRGVLILDAQRPQFEFYYPERFCGYGSLESVLTLPRLGANIGGSILMEFIDNPLFDVDVVMQGGRAAIVVPRMRHLKQGMNVISMGHQLNFRADVVQLAAQAAEVIGFSHIGDMDIGTTAAGALSAIDASCRFSGSVNAAVGAGLSLPLQAIRSVLGLPFLELEVTDGLRCVPFTQMVSTPPEPSSQRVSLPQTTQLATQAH